MTAAAEWRQRQEGLLVAMTLDGKTKQRDLARHAVISAFLRFEQLHGEHGRRRNIDDFILCFRRDGWGSFEHRIPSDFRALVQDLSHSTLYRWLNKIKTGKHLGGYYGEHRKGSGIIDTQRELAEFVVGLMFDKPHISNKTLYAGLQARFAGRSDIQIPARRSLDRWISAWKTTHAEVFCARENPDAWKSRYMSAAGKFSADIERINQRWELDSSPADVLLQDGRHSLIACIDVYSRRGCLLVAKTSKAAAIALLLRRCMLDWGIPEMLKTDNGQDYVSLHIQRVCAMLGVRHECSAPLSPWEKPHIERLFRTFSHGVFELLPGFIGHNVAEREAIRARESFADRLFKKDTTVELRMNSQELQQFCDQWVANIYHHDTHSGIGTTPFLRAQMCREPVRVIETPRILDLLLAEAPSNNGLRTVGKAGIRLDREVYDAPELEAYRNQTVQVLYDPEDLGRVYVYAHDRPEDPLTTQPIKAGFHFVCIAECASLLGLSRDDQSARASETRGRQTKRVQGERRALNQIAKRIKPDAVAKEIVEHRKAQTSNVIALPKSRTSHQSPGVAAASEALKAEAYGPLRLLDSDLNDIGACVAEVEQRLDEAARAPRSDRPLFESFMTRCLWIFGEIEAGRLDAATLTGEDKEFLFRFKTLDPKGHRAVEDILAHRYAGRWEHYQSLRRVVGWPETQRPGIYD
ncbi:MAG: Mu transposase C-terminal domain-containing protein [Methylotetracoccus sp.]